VWAGGGAVWVLPGGVGGQVALAGSHLVKAASDKLAQAHEGVGFGGGLVGVVFGGREGSVPVLEEGEVSLLLEKRIRGFDRGGGRERLR
jgi:hypothetical protein